MKKPHLWMPFYIGDYRTDTLDLTTEQHGAYMVLLMISWLRKDGIPNDMDGLKRAMRGFCSDMHGNRFNRVVPYLLERYFTLDTDGLWRQRRLEIEREKSRKFSEYAREKANKRWRRTKVFNGLSDAGGMPARPRLQSHIEESTYSFPVAAREAALEPVAKQAATEKRPAAKSVASPELVANLTQKKLNGGHHG